MKFGSDIILMQGWTDLPIRAWKIARPIRHAKKTGAQIKVNLYILWRNKWKDSFLFFVSSIALAAFIFIAIPSKVFAMSLCNVIDVSMSKIRCV